MAVKGRTRCPPEQAVAVFSPSSSPRHIMLHPTASQLPVSTGCHPHTALPPDISSLPDKQWMPRATLLPGGRRTVLRPAMNLPSRQLCCAFPVILVGLLLCEFIVVPSAGPKTSFLATTSNSPVFLGSLGWGCTELGRRFSEQGLGKTLSLPRR